MGALRRQIIHLRPCVPVIEAKHRRAVKQSPRDRRTGPTSEER